MRKEEGEVRDEGMRGEGEVGVLMGEERGRRG